MLSNVRPVPAPHALEPDQRARIKEWVQDYKPLRPYAKHLKNYWAECRDWHLARGIYRADWEAQFRIWMRNQLEIDSGNYTKKHELPQQSRNEEPPEDNVVPITDALKEFQK